ncbi:TIGR03747 family integrating conjugative element membrane protein [Vibrio parahaemolyticus]|uniref:TIGR03747 family integrating conjugative element membrane protein n=1 Tax=Vibrio parahaemolyticus TaxID=670 RepID=UPI001EEBB027|nr:TIGR03747 family integrating conjugative element membrane protein [Vibrio parahaemolyticus]MCG6490233.1 TIGR03747 family integrating conjugative element membrane protein [Vibrio parahaemolyticus]
MSHVNAPVSPSPPRTAPQSRGLLTSLLWDLPWRLAGILLVSLLFSLIMEYIGIAFFRPEQGAEYSRRVMLAERDYFAAGFTQSLLLSAPVTTVQDGIAQVSRWLFTESGFIGGMHSTTAVKSGNGVTDGLNAWRKQITAAGYPYLMATVHVTQIFLMRVAILILSAPLFIMAAITGFTDGMVRRDLRRYGAASESSFLYHHAKRAVKPALYLPCILYLSAPFTVYPNGFLLPAALLTGVAISVTAGSFKKYL